MVVVGVFIAPTTIPTVDVDGHTGQSGGAPDMALFIVRWCTGHGIVHCPVRATSANRWGLERLTVEVICPLAAPDSPVRSDFAVLNTDFCSVHCTVVSAVDCWRS
jgi:hypothetical protein